MAFLVLMDDVDVNARFTCACPEEDKYNCVIFDGIACGNKRTLVRICRNE
jgi:hypothetical protein